MQVKIATSQDKEQIFKLFDEFSLLLKSSEIPSQVGQKIFDEVIGREDIKIFVAEENGQIIGISTLYLLPNIRHGWHRGNIEDFFVTATMRDKGVGTLLFSHIKEYCQKNNIKVIKLSSGNDLINAHKFYEKNGGKSTERSFRFDL